MSYPGWQWDGTSWQRVAGQPKKKHTALIAVLSTVGGVLALCVGVAVVGVIASSGSSDQRISGDANTGAGGGQVGQEAEPGSPEDETLPTVGRDGKFEFTVLEVQTGVSEVNQMPDNEFWEGETAQGEYVLITVQVENIGDVAQTFSDFNQYAYDAEDRRFEADTIAGWEANEGTDSWLTDINPGNTVTGILVFDVPPGTELVKLKLHDSAFSGGVELGLP